MFAYNGGWIDFNLSKCNCQQGFDDRFREKIGIQVYRREG